MTGIKFLLLIFLPGMLNAQTVLFVSGNGNDKNNGSIDRPLKTLNTAVSRSMAMTSKDVIINIRKGTYFLPATIVIKADHLKVRSLKIQAYNAEKVTISGAMALTPLWTKYKGKRFKTKMNWKKSPDRLFIGDRNLPMARYPNYDSTARVFNGTSADAISKERVSHWKKPEGAYVHALHHGEWGGLHFTIKGKNIDGEPILEGGWQNNRPAPMHEQYRFVENIFEELDAPGEWYYDEDTKLLYFYPVSEKNLTSNNFYVTRLNELIAIKGSSASPARNITVSNIRFTGTNRTFMLTNEPLLRSDWTIYRGGALLLDGTENISVNNCTFDNLGGNAVFLSNYNRNCIISDNHIQNIGASAIAFVGNPDAVRSPSFRYEQFVPWSEMDYSPGPLSDNYPQNCTASGNLIHNIGLIEKQVAGIQISMSSDLNITHNTIYNVPRAGINVGDGCWGGHVIEYNDVFNTVLETGDHGAFNSWGRDRFWRPEREITDSIIIQKKGIELLDAMKPVTIRNNRFHCEHGWDIDLDDGSSNYHIYNNVCLNGGLKLREGYERIVRNNVIVNNTFHPHVWYEKSRDVFANNIVGISYAPIMIKNWGAMVDSNFFLTSKGVELARKNGTDAHSISGNPYFTDPDKNNFTIKSGSPAKGIGFINFPMTFGVTSAALKNLAAKPPMTSLLVKESSSPGSVTQWLGSSLKNIETLGERSAAGVANNNGALVVTVQQGSLSSKSNLQAGDVITKVGSENVASVSDFIDAVQKMKWMGRVESVVIRNQREQNLQLLLKE